MRTVGYGMISESEHFPDLGLHDLIPFAVRSASAAVTGSPPVGSVDPRADGVFGLTQS